MLLHMCPLQYLHMGEQYNPVLRHPRVFRQPVLQPHDTIRNTLVGASGRSVLSGTKLPSLYCQPQSVGHKSIVALLFSRVLHTRCYHIRAHAVALSVTMVRSSGEQGSSSSRQHRRWAIVCGSPQSQLTDCVLSM